MEIPWKTPARGLRLPCGSERETGSGASRSLVRSAEAGWATSTVRASRNHPNVVAVHDVGVHDGIGVIVTELLEGETLRQRMNGRPVPPPKAIDYAIQIARGLAAGHDRGIVHRDIKPDNLFVTNDGR